MSSISGKIFHLFSKNLKHNVTFFTLYTQLCVKKVMFSWYKIMVNNTQQCKENAWEEHFYWCSTQLSWHTLIRWSHNLSCQNGQRNCQNGQRNCQICQRKWTQSNKRSWINSKQYSDLSESLSALFIAHYIPLKKYRYVSLAKPSSQSLPIHSLSPSFSPAPLSLLPYACQSYIQGLQCPRTLPPPHPPPPPLQIPKIGNPGGG